MALGDGLQPLLLAQPVGIGHVQILDVQRVHVVFDGLEPVAGKFADAHVARPAILHKDIEARQQRRGGGTHVGPEQSAHLLHRIGLDSDAILQRAAGGFSGLIDTAPRVVELPAVIRAYESVRIHQAVLKRNTAVRAALGDQTVTAVGRTEQDKVFSEQAHRSHWLVFHGRDGSCGQPVGAHQLAARRAGADLCQATITVRCFIAFVCCVDHFSRPPGKNVSRGPHGAPGQATRTG